MAIPEHSSPIAGMLLASRSTSVRNQEPRRIRQSPRSAGSVKPGQTIVKAAHLLPGAPFAWLILLVHHAPNSSASPRCPLGDATDFCWARNAQTKRPTRARTSASEWLHCGRNAPLHRRNLLLPGFYQNPVPHQGLFSTVFTSMILAFLPVCSQKDLRHCFVPSRSTTLPQCLQR